MSAITIGNTTGIFPSGTMLAIRRTGTLTNCALSGAYSGGTPTDVEASWNGSSYTPLSATIGGGAWSATLADQASTGQTYANGTLTVRWANDHAVTATCTMQIGDAVGIVSDSTGITVGTGENLGITTGVPVWIWVAGDDLWVNLLATDGGFQWSRLGEQLRAALGYPVFVVFRAVGGTRLNADYLPGQGNYVVFQNYYAASKVPPLKWIYMQLGSNTVSPSSTPLAAAYAADIATFASGVLADFGCSSALHMMMADKASGTWPTPADYRVDFDKVRQGIKDAVTAGTIGMGANLTGEVYTDATHPDSVALGREIAWRTWAAIARYAYGDTSIPRSPRVTSVTIDSTKKIVRITFSEALSNSIGSSVAGFCVMDDGTVVTITDQIVTSARVVTLTLPSTIVGTCTVSFASSEDAIGQTLPVGVAIPLPDTSVVSSITLPAEPFFGTTATDYIPPTAQFSTLFMGPIHA